MQNYITRIQTSDGRNRCKYFNARNIEEAIEYVGKKVEELFPRIEGTTEAWDLAVKKTGKGHIWFPALVKRAGEGQIWEHLSFPPNYSFGIHTFNEYDETFPLLFPDASIRFIIRGEYWDGSDEAPYGFNYRYLNETNLEDAVKKFHMCDGELFIWDSKGFGIQNCYSLCIKRVGRKHKWTTLFNRGDKGWKSFIESVEKNKEKNKEKQLLLFKP